MKGMKAPCLEIIGNAVLKNTNGKQDILYRKGD